MEDWNESSIKDAWVISVYVPSSLIVRLLLVDFPAFSDIVFVSREASDISLRNQPHCLDLECSVTAAAARILKKKCLVFSIFP